MGVIILRFFRSIYFNAPVTLYFVFISLIVYIIAMLTDGVSNILFFSVYRSAWDNPFAYIRIFTHVLGHSGLEHYFGNMMMILLLGPIVEARYGSKQLLLFIVITALVTGVANIILFPYAALLGASGIVFMLIILCSLVNYDSGRIPITFILVVVIYLGREIFYSFTVEDDVSRITHVVGGICGAGLGFYINKRNKRGNSEYTNH